MKRLIINFRNELICSFWSLNNEFYNPIICYVFYLKCCPGNSLIALLCYNKIFSWIFYLRWNNYNKHICLRFWVFQVWILQNDDNNPLKERMWLMRLKFEVYIVVISLISGKIWTTCQINKDIEAFIIIWILNDRSLIFEIFSSYDWLSIQLFFKSWRPKISFDY